MKGTSAIIPAILLLLVSCTTHKKLTYLNNISQPDGQESFLSEIPNYTLQNRDIVYVTIKAMTPEGRIVDFLRSDEAGSGYQMSGESGGYLFGYEVDKDGNIILPVLGPVKVKGHTLYEIRKLIQGRADSIFRGSTVECKLLSFRFTVIGEVQTPGTYMNNSNYLTVLEAIGRAGGISDFGRRDRIIVVRPVEAGTKTFSLNLQDKAILSSEAYFLLPNDVVIVEPQAKKIFNLNLPTISFIFTSVTSAITTTLLLINYFK